MKRTRTFELDHFKALQNEDGTIVKYVPEDDDDYFYTRALQINRRRPEILQDLKTNCSATKVIPYVLEKYSNDCIFLNDTLWRVVLQNDLYAYTYHHTQNIKVYMLPISEMERLLMTKTSFEESELLTMLYTIREFRLNIYKLYVDNMVKNVTWGPVVLTAIRDYCIHEDRYYVDTCVERARVLECIEKIFVKPTSNNHLPLPKTFIGGKPKMNKPTLSKLLGITEPSFRTIAESKEFQWKKPFVVEEYNDQPGTTVFLLHNDLCESLVRENFGNEAVCFPRGEKITGSFDNVVVVFATRRDQEIWRQCKHPLIPNISRLESYILHCAGPSVKRAFYYRNKTI